MDRTWKNFFNKNCLAPDKIQQTSFLLAHRVLPVNELMIRRGQNSSTCALCLTPSEPESICHAFWRCRTISPIWDFFGPVLNKITGRRTLRKHTALGLVRRGDNLNRAQRHLVNFIVQHIIHWLWWHRQQVTKTKCPTCVPIILQIIISQIKAQLKMQYQILWARNGDTSHRQFSSTFALGDALCKIESGRLIFTI